MNCPACTVKLGLKVYKSKLGGGFTCTEQVDCLLWLGLEWSVTVTTAWKVPATVNTLDTLCVLPETAPLQVYA